jgi:hypothetical protein
MSHVVPYAWFYLTVILAGVILGFYLYWKAKTKIINKNAADLKQSGIGIPVNLMDCAIKHREFYDENEDGTKELKHISILIYKTKINGTETEFRTPPIYLSKERLVTRIDTQKKTTIYVDPQNRTNYYFDLEFIIEFVM